MKITYIGSWHQVSSEGYQFVRGIPVEVDMDTAEKLLAAKIADQNIFEEAA